MKDIPHPYETSLQLLRAGYPSGIPEEEIDTLIAVMKDTGMSDRSVANVLSLWLDQPYAALLHRVATNVHSMSVTDEGKQRIVQRLRAHGFDAWALEA